MILVILQARVSSSRLPEKVLKSILGLPMLLRVIERTQRATLINHLLVATSNNVTDNPIAQICSEIGVKCFRGQLDDVLDRFYQAAKQMKSKHIVRLTADCPLIDPCLVDQVIKFHLEGDFDYSSNSIEPTYPDGLDVEVLRFTCLESAFKQARLFSEREHVTPFIHQQPDLFKIGSYKHNIDLSSLRWTVDEDLDLELVRIIYESLYPGKPDFTTQDILDLLDKHPDLKTYNTCYKRNEGFQKSLIKDASCIEKILDRN